ncbi:MAG: glycosyltransferase family 4 protein [Victivallales bacterium]|nr:glycosyltransferase family 4 protein [Victivallales bacterium]
MKILVSCIPYDNGKSGISVYTRELVCELVRQGHSITLLLEPGISCADLGVSCNVVNAPNWTKKAVFSMLWHLLVLPFWILFHKGKYQGMIICAANRRVCAFYPLPTIATVHDLANFHIEDKYSKLRMFYLAHILPFFAKRMRHLVAVSGSTKSDILDYWRCKDRDVSVLYNGCVATQKHWTGKHGSSILYISRIEHPGKNHLRLIRAYGTLEHDLAKKHPLVLAGADWKDAELVHEAAKASPNADCIHFTGFVKDIGKLWDEAGFYVFPSLFEGFGLSLVEAMAYGIPCACSNNGSLGEIAGDVAITFAPNDEEGIAHALRQLLEEGQEAREQRIARGIKHARQFSWGKHATGIIKLLEANGR